jgi:hypothetical protein
MERVESSYSRPIVEASRSALLELSLTLRSYADALVLVGGWVPYFLLRDHRAFDSDFEHVGSIDIDLVVDPDKIGADEYATIIELITNRGWEPRESRQFSFTRQVASSVDGRPYAISVDFLAASPDKLVGGGRHRKVQRDLNARIMRGAPLALAHQCRISIDARLPSGGWAASEIRMADVVSCIAMKGLALGGRLVEKDAYDIYAVLDNLDGGPTGVASAFRPFAGDPLVAESIDNIRRMFLGPESAGALLVADFYPGERGSARERRALRASQIVSAFIEALG